MLFFLSWKQITISNLQSLRDGMALISLNTSLPFSIWVYWPSHTFNSGVRRSQSKAHCPPIYSMYETYTMSDIAVPMYNPSTLKVEAGGSQVWGVSVLHSMVLSQQNEHHNSKGWAKNKNDKHPASKMAASGPTSCISAWCGLSRSIAGLHYGKNRI